MKDLYELLGVLRDDPTFEWTLKKRYYALSKEFHPDMCKVSDSRKFQEIKIAYDILKDPESRKFYDETGLILEGGSIQLKAEAISILNNFINQWIDASLNNQSVRELNEFLTNGCLINIKEVEQNVNLHSSGIQKLEKMLTEIIYSGSEKNLSEQIIETKLFNAKSQLNFEIRKLESLKICLKISSEYKSTSKQQPSTVFVNNFGQSFYTTTT